MKLRYIYTSGQTIDIKFKYKEVVYMPTKRFENLDPERSMQILDTAQQEFARNGYEGASLNEIVRKAGISKGSLYYYFEDKTDLFITVIGHLFEEAVVEIGGMYIEEYSDDFWEDYANLCESNVHFTLKNPDVIRLGKELMHLSITGNASEAVHALFSKGLKLFEKILRRGQEIGAVRTDIPLDLLTMLLFHLGQGFDEWMFNRWESISEQEIKHFVEIFIDMSKKVTGIESQKGGS